MIGCKECEKLTSMDCGNHRPAPYVSTTAQLTIEVETRWPGGGKEAYSYVVLALGGNRTITKIGGSSPTLAMLALARALDLVAESEEMPI